MTREMTREEKAKFVGFLINDVAWSISARLDAIPAAWDGVELSQYVADLFAAQTRKMSRKRLVAYRNAIATTGGL